MARRARNESEWKVSISITLPRSLFLELEKERGDINRSIHITNILMKRKKK